MILGALEHFVGSHPIKTILMGTSPCTYSRCRPWHPFRNSSWDSRIRPGPDNTWGPDPIRYGQVPYTSKISHTVVHGDRETWTANRWVVGSKKVRSFLSLGTQLGRPFTILFICFPFHRAHQLLRIRRPRQTAAHPTRGGLTDVPLANEVQLFIYFSLLKWSHLKVLR